MLLFELPVREMFVGVALSLLAVGLSRSAQADDQVKSADETQKKAVSLVDAYYREGFEEITSNYEKARKP